MKKRKNDSELTHIKMIAAQSGGDFLLPNGRDFNHVAAVWKTAYQDNFCPHGVWGRQPQLFAAPNGYQLALLAGLLFT